jgi:hypothetical protein
MPLDINVELATIRDRYTNDTSQKTFNCLLYGKSGSGKTYSLRTCRRPILIHSFDQGGTKGLRDELSAEHATLFADTRFETEDSKHPTVAAMWDREMDRLTSIKFFDHIGTYCIDSFTTWVQAVMNHVMATTPRAAKSIPGIPMISDYQLGGNMIRDAVKRINALVCDVICTGHVAVEKDEATGGMENALATYPSLRTVIPLLFDEIYVALPQRTSTGTDYRFLTQNDGLYIARTRLGSPDTDNKSRFEKYEPADFKALLTKIGWPTTDRS